MVKENEQVDAGLDALINPIVKYKCAKAELLPSERVYKLPKLGNCRTYTYMPITKSNKNISSSIYFCYGVITTL